MQFKLSNFLREEQASSLRFLLKAIFPGAVRFIWLDSRCKTSCRVTETSQVLFQVFVKSKVTSLSDAVNLSDDERLFRQLLRRPDAYVLFPTKTSRNAADIFNNVKSSNNSYVLVVIDGTWREAKKMYVRSPVLQNLPAIHLDLRVIERKSEYVVRTQPTEQCLSTVEIVAHTIEILENDPSVVEKLVAPLRALCRSRLQQKSITCSLIKLHIQWPSEY
jgi:DTW domain-containing protein YfiP